MGVYLNQFGLSFDTDVGNLDTFRPQSEKISYLTENVFLKSLPFLTSNFFVFLSIVGFRMKLKQKLNLYVENVIFPTLFT